MKVTKFAVLAGIVIASASPAIAQDATATTAATDQAAAAPLAAPAPAPARMLPESTLVQLVNDAEISSKRIELGQNFLFTVVNDVVENGVVAIPRGSKVVATVTYKTGKAVGGKSGKFELSFDRITVRGQNYAMRGTHRQEGKGNTVAAVFGSLFVSGRSAVMVPGQMVNAFTANPIPY